jgi:PPOX class probable F420-dependent enzyme
MATLNDLEVSKLLEGPNHAVVSTHNQDGSILNTVAWVSRENGSIAVNSAIGRRWPTNLQRDPQITVLVMEEGNPYNYVEIRGRAEADREHADAHINQLAKKYIGKDEYPFRQPGEERIKFLVKPEHIRHQKQS